MKATSRKSDRNKLLRLVVIFFIICLVGMIFLIQTLVREQSFELVGKPDPNLNNGRKTYLELLFFFKQDEIQKPNDLATDYVLAIQSGEPLDEIIHDLNGNNVTRDPSILRDMLIYTGADQRILPGKYLIPARSSDRDVVKILQDINASLVDFTILPGWRKEEIAQALPTSGLSISIEEFLEWVNQPVDQPDLADPAIISHEGFLIPGQYSFKRDITVDGFVNTFVYRFRQNLTGDLMDAYTNQGLTTYQAVTLASIIQREAVLDEEKPLIASVFLNRLRNGMQLQTDPTVQYALGYSQEHGWWKSPLNLNDLQVDSVYNTYIIFGLPPAPICNPDLTSLEAVAYPEESEYFYFRAACDGSGRHVFSKTMEEHSMNGCVNSES